MTFADFQKAIKDSGHKSVALGLHNRSPQSRRLTPENYCFYDETLQYLVTMISASIGKWASIGGTVQEGALDVNMIGRALDEDIYFSGIPLMWANSSGYPVTELELDVRPVPKNEKDLSHQQHVAMRDVGARADAVFFLRAFESVKDKIYAKFGEGWFTKWPEILRFAYLIRNALAHDGCWEIREQKGKEHYQIEVFRWPRANLEIRMRNKDGSKADGGRPVLEYLNGADFVVLLIEINDALR